MQPFRKHRGVAVPLDLPDVDTDQIIPKQYLRSIKRTGFGPNLFDDWRYLDGGEGGAGAAAREPDPAFVLNRDIYAGATVLLARENFGCGSSREHAVWALMDYGFRAVISVSYGDIFANNSVKNGLLAARVAPADLDELFALATGDAPAEIEVDLEESSIRAGTNSYGLLIDDSSRKRLLEGLDDIALTLMHRDEIKAYEENRRRLEPWLYPERA